MKLKDYFKLIRLEHCIKNGLLFAPLLFSNNINLYNLSIILLGFICFSFMSFSVYIINDLIDYEQDKKNKIKKDSPIQRGIISNQNCISIAIIFFILANTINIIFFDIKSLIILNAYFILNILYSKYIKNKAYVEFICFILFYLFRLYFGAFILNLNLSLEIILFVFICSLYLITNKRINEKKNKINKVSLKKYNTIFLIRLSNTLELFLITIYTYWLLKYFTITNFLSLFIFIYLVIKFKNYNSYDIVSFITKNIKNLILIIIYALLILL